MEIIVSLTLLNIRNLNNKKENKKQILMKLIVDFVQVSKSLVVKERDI